MKSAPSDYASPQAWDPLSQRLLAIHIDCVTRNAGTRRRKQRGGKALTLAIALAAVTLLVFGRGIA